MRRTNLCFLFLMFFICGYAQPKGALVDDLEVLIKAEKFADAKKLLDARIPVLLSAAYPDTLISYPKYIGKVNAKLTNDETAINEVKVFAEKVRAIGVPDNVLLRVYLEAAVFYSLKGKHALSYKTVEEGARYTRKLIASSAVDAALVQSELGVYGYRMGNIGLSALHHRRATAMLEALAVPNYERMYNSYNSMGTIMWFSSKADSGLYFFRKAIDALARLSPTPENKYYRVAVVQNNIAQIYNEQGNTTEAIHTMEQSILNYKTFLASKEPNPKKDFAMIRQYEAVDNLARAYRHLGDFSRAEFLLNYSYREKLKFLPPRGPDVYKSVISLGSLYFEQMNFRKAEQFLLDGLRMVNEEPSPSQLWAGEASDALSRMYDAIGDTGKAAAYYHQTDSLYELSYQGQYDETYLDFLRKSSLFYARQKQGSLALAKAKKGYNYVLETQGRETLGAFYQVLNLGSIEYELGNYKTALKLSTDAMGIVNKRISASTQLLDSVKAELNKPAAILLGARAAYELLQPGNVDGLKGLVAELNGALQIIQRRKAIIKDADDITLMMSQQKELLSFTKELQVKLYELTGDESLIDEMINLHESAIYNRIRSRLDKQQAVRFAEVPLSIQQQEEALIRAVTTSLKTGRNESDGLQLYIRAEKNWQVFQSMLRSKYPKYYAMRYADTRKHTVSELSKLVPEGTTVIRYLNIGKTFYALVADGKKHQWLPLAAGNVDDWVKQLTDVSADPVLTGTLCFNLYKALWQPLEKFIHTSRVTIIPDGSLYYLSFEMLTRKKAVTFEELVQSSLLSSYAISYHYSLFALGSGSSPAKPTGNFAAFVPGFSDDVKKQYVTSLHADSLVVDNEYLTLLPLPFTVDLARKIQGSLGGNLFVGDQSTPGAFRTRAGNHAIIHIGTHAEANNLNPEFSRLIFAKDPNNVNDSNSVFMYDIYNYDLGSDLAVLTACETGRPGLNDGEGMISMAHAFSYAGSRSILTGLWKIDEKASCVITDFFYKNLQDGMSKDVALQQAKLSYLKTAKGRTLGPQYWAGLVIMGDPSPVVFKKSNGIPWLAIAGGVMLVAMLIILYRWQQRNARG